MSETRNDVTKHYRWNKNFMKAALAVLTRPVLAKTGAKVERYTPKHDTFVLIANHSDPLDPGFEMIALNRYIRFVASDHLMRSKAGGWVLKNLGGVIVKHRESPSSVLTDEILANLRAGIPVGIHAEGGTSVNGETGFISEHTGQLVKDSGVALITFRFTGGYLRTPRWSKKNRKGPLFCKVVGEYSPEEIAAMSVSEVTQLIRRDTFVNVYDEQRKVMAEYTGEALAEYVERTLFMCPKCGKVGDLHSHDDLLRCDACGYTVRYGTDAFFHDTGSGLVFDNVCDWDKWQIKEWKERVLAVPAGDLIFEECGQIVYQVSGSEKTVLSENATLKLYPDRFEIVTETETIPMMFGGIRKAQLASKEALILIDDAHYFDVRTQKPRAATKYVAAWRFLTGKEYL